MSSVKKMGVVQLTMLTSINMMGSGIILLPSKLAEVGTISIFSWLVTALGSLALAYCFAQCGILSRKPGGMFGYAEYPFGMAGHFLSNYVYCISILVSNVAIALTAVGYAAVLFDTTLPPIGVVLSTILILWIATIANFGGSRFTGQISSIAIWCVILPVFVLCIIGWFWFSPSIYIEAWNPHQLPTFKAISSSIAVTLWAFLGLESACANSDAVENPKKNVPIAVIAGTLAAAIIYILSTNIIAGIVPNFDLANSTAPFGLVFSMMFTPFIGKIVMSLMCLACIGSLLGWQFTFAQVCKSGSETGFYSKIFAKVNKTGAPVIGMIIITSIQTLLACMTISSTLAKQFDILLHLAVFINILPYILSIAALVVMQKMAKVAASKVKVTSVIMVIAIIYTFYAIYNTGSEARTWGSITTFIGWIIYGWFLAPKFEKERLER